jgi:hypothetical protein
MAHPVRTRRKSEVPQAPSETRSPIKAQFRQHALSGLASLHCKSLKETSAQTLSSAEDKEVAEYWTVTKHIETCLDLFQSIGKFSKHTLSGPD